MDTKYYLGFSLFNGIGPILFEKLLKTFGSAKNAWHASKPALASVLKGKRTAQFLAFRKSVDLDEEFEKVVQKDITLITRADKKYPTLLGKIPHPPFLLYVKGNTKVLSFPKSIGVVGTRKITEYGKRVTNMFTEELVKEGFVVVSGLAFGVDATAHMATINNNGKTIAVLGCGVDCCTPVSNQRIYDAIIKSNGAIVSTFRPEEQAVPGSFPARNKIIAGLSLGILVTEGAVDSGALITAHDAKKFGRPVFSVPGPITSSLSEGANNLIREGAIPITKTVDILDTIGIIANGKSPTNAKAMVDRQMFKEWTKEEKQIIKLLENSPLHFDEIVRRIKKDSKYLGSLLSLMELQGIVHSNGSIYSL